MVWCMLLDLAVAVCCVCSTCVFGDVVLQYAYVHIVYVCVCVFDVPLCAAFPSLQPLDMTALNFPKRSK